MAGSRRRGMVSPLEISSEYPGPKHHTSPWIDRQVRPRLRCAFYSLGIIGMLGAYGVIQERIMSEPYDSEFFRDSVFLVLCNRLVAIVYALLMVGINGESLSNSAPLWKYFAISMSNVAATWSQYEALKYVSLPVQMLGKSFKMMPVMLWGIIISRKTYRIRDWLVAAFVTWGVSQFLLTGDISAKHADRASSFQGLVLLLIFLACDGFTSAYQEKLFHAHETSKYNQMLFVNGGSSVVSAVTLVMSGKSATALSFCRRHPSFIGDTAALSAAAVGGQYFIYSEVKEFGALVLAANMNLRQVVSILISYATYGHPISALQALGLLLVFGALFFKSYDNIASHGEPRYTAVRKAASDAELELPSPTALPQTIGASGEGRAVGGKAEWPQPEARHVTTCPPDGDCQLPAQTLAPKTLGLDL